MAGVDSDRINLSPFTKGYRESALYMSYSKTLIYGSELDSLIYKALREIDVIPKYIIYNQYLELN